MSFLNFVYGQKMSQKILYKYVTLDTLLKIIIRKTILFGDFDSFNDPFELRSQEPSEELDNNLSNLGSIAKEIDRIVSLRKGYCAYCLTRNPLNPLMWAHYTDSHRGFVIGIDVEEAGFNCTKRNVVTANRGSIVYTHTKPSFTDCEEYTQVEELDAEMLQRLFLYKSMHWSYEEEVRVVRKVDPEKQLLGFNKYEIPFELTSIKRIYIGVRNVLAERKHILEHRQSTSNFFKGVLSNAELGYVYIPGKSWNLTSDLLEI